jgi:2-polyprenyl-3-methyl-5-hydroxy-6-metoxy-1,4-benzoquinol methylase
MKQTGFTEKDVSTSTSSWRIDMWKSWQSCLVDELGRSTKDLGDKADDDINGLSAKKICDGLCDKGWEFSGVKILDVGSGHGSLALEMARRGAFVIGIEPCHSWRKIASKRGEDEEFSEQVNFTNGDAHSLQFNRDSFDYVTCIQVLEHVSNPNMVITEMARVLKNGGRMLLTCENYLSSYEGHYQVPWLPMLPKFLGAHYLRCIGRNPDFLINNVTYTYHPKVLFSLLHNNLIDTRWLPGLAKIDQPSNIAKGFYRYVATFANQFKFKFILLLIYSLRRDRKRLFSSGSRFHVVKITKLFS